jgi:hypothetical protein
LRLCSEVDLGGDCEDLPIVDGQCTSLFPGPFNDNVRSISTEGLNLDILDSLTCTIYQYAPLLLFFCIFLLANAAYSDDPCTGTSDDIPIGLLFPTTVNVPDNLVNDVSAFKCTSSSIL